MSLTQTPDLKRQTPGLSLRRNSGCFLRRARRHGRRNAVSRKRFARTKRAAGANAFGRETLRIVRRCQPNQRAEPKVDRCARKKSYRQIGPQLPIYFGNRNWHPLLADTLRTMRDDGVKKALAFVTSAYSSYSSCRQYLEDIERARAAVGAGRAADREAARLLQSSGIHRGKRCACSRCAQTNS